jgi:hypothetical protein
MADAATIAFVKNTSYVSRGKGLGRATKVRKVFEQAGYLPGKIDEYRVGIQSGRYPPGTLAFSVVDWRGGKPRFPGTVIFTPLGEIVVVPSTGEHEDELWTVIRDVW